MAVSSVRPDIIAFTPRSAFAAKVAAGSQREPLAEMAESATQRDNITPIAAPHLCEGWRRAAGIGRAGWHV